MARLANWPGMGKALRLAVLLGAAAMLAVPLQATAGVGKPVLERGKGERCVEDTEYMRRHHMDLLKHQRDKTMRQGIRTTKHSLKGCVECHASSKTGSVASTKEDFCAACHVYSGVKLDCWDCHATKPKKTPAPSTTQQTSPLMESQVGGL
ncbi:MAG: hypothetical protein MUC79_15120 [Thiobacillaceae bacterium]|nr:hypothetical protein [Thiobacillaceae bacterium]